MNPVEMVVECWDSLKFSVWSSVGVFCVFSLRISWKQGIS